MTQSNYDLGYGGQPYGGGPYGGGSPTPDRPGELITASSTVGPPYLISSNPVNNQNGVVPNAPVSFVLGSTGIGVDPNSIQVTLAGIVCIQNGLFLTGYAGTVLSTGGGNVTVNILTHPPFTATKVVVVIVAKSL